MNKMLRIYWPILASLAILALAAKSRQVLTYDIVAKLVGVPRQGLGQVLDPIQSYCMMEGLPPLTILVVREDSGLPGAGFIAAADIPKTKIAVFAYDWLERGAPSPDALERAVAKMPSNGVKPAPNPPQS
jgi:hypothetical protein